MRKRSRSAHSLQEVVDWLKRDAPRSGPQYPYSFSSTEYTLLAFIVELVSGVSYAEFLRKNIFEPLGLHDTGHDGDAAVSVPPLAARYVAAGAVEVEQAPELHWSILTGTASLYSTVDDLYRWDRSLYGDKVLTDASRKKMFALGYGWTRMDPGKSAMTNTRPPGAEANYERFADSEVFVAVLSNVFSSLTYSMSDDLVAISLGGTRISTAPSRRVKVAQGILERYAGRYQFGADSYAPHVAIEVRRNGDRLALVSMQLFAPFGTSYLIPSGTNEFVDRSNGGTVVFETVNGRTVGLVWKLSQHYKARKLE